MAIFGNQIGRKKKYSADDEEMIARTMWESGLGMHKVESKKGGAGKGALSYAMEQFGISENQAHKISKKYFQGFDENKALQESEGN